MPDGYVIILDSDRKGVNINVTQIELVRCKHCKHCFLAKFIGASYLVCEEIPNAPKMVDETDWCCWGERDDENGNVER